MDVDVYGILYTYYIHIHTDRCIPDRVWLLVVVFVYLIILMISIVLDCVV